MKKTKYGDESHARVVHGRKLVHCTARGGGREWRRDEARIVQVVILFLILVFLLYLSSKSDIQAAARFEYSSSGGFLERTTAPFHILLSPCQLLIND